MWYGTLCDFWHFFQSRFLDRSFCSAFECSRLISVQTDLIVSNHSPFVNGRAYLLFQKSPTFLSDFCHILAIIRSFKVCLSSSYENGEWPKTYLSEQGSERIASYAIGESCTSLCLKMIFPSPICSHCSNMICRSLNLVSFITSSAVSNRHIFL